MAGRRSVFSGPFPGRQVVGVAVAGSTFGTEAASNPMVTPAALPGGAPGLNASGTEKMASVRASFEPVADQQTYCAASGAATVQATSAAAAPRVANRRTLLRRTSSFSAPMSRTPDGRSRSVTTISTSAGPSTIRRRGSLHPTAACSGSLSADRATAARPGAGARPATTCPPGRHSSRHAGVGLLPGVEVVAPTVAPLRARHRQPRAWVPGRRHAASGIPRCWGAGGGGLGDLSARFSEGYHGPRRGRPSLTGASQPCAERHVRQPAAPRARHAPGPDARRSHRRGASSGAMPSPPCSWSASTAWPRCPTAAGGRGPHRSAAFLAGDEGPGHDRCRSGSTRCWRWPARSS